MSKSPKSEWKKRETEWKCTVFKMNYEAWSKRILEKTGRKGTQELCSFLIENPSKHFDDVWEALQRERDYEKRISCTKIQQWLKSAVCPDPKSIKAICEVFGISPEVFETSSAPFPFNTYYDSSYVSKELKDRHSYAEEIGLSESFTHYVTKIENITDVFPFMRSNYDSSELIPEDKNNPYLIPNTDGEGHSDYITHEEMDYLKRLSAEVEEFIKGKMLLERHRVILQSGEDGFSLPKHKSKFEEPQISKIKKLSQDHPESISYIEEE